MTKLKQIWIGIKTSFWFIPALINAALICFAFFIIELDQLLAVTKHPIALKLFSYQQESVRTFLATIAGSMMTIAGVVFSITILVLAQTAGQYSSRVLRNFMRKKSNQMILGIFIGIFICSLFLITNLHPTDNVLTTFSGFVLAIMGVGFLIYYIHQTSISIQASEIIYNVYEETLEGIEKMYPNPYCKREESSGTISGEYSVVTLKTGYIQAIDVGALLSLAEEYKTTTFVKKKVGDFIAFGETVCELSTDLLENQEFLRRLYNTIFIGKYRTAEEDVAFGIQQIVDIALRGLSPGFNDLSTAQTAIDYLGSIYIILASRDFGTRAYVKDNKLITFIPGQTFSTFLEMSFNSIFANARGQPTIQALLNDTIKKVKDCTVSPERKSILDGYSCPIA